MSLRDRDDLAWAGYTLAIYLSLYFVNAPMLWLFERGALRIFLAATLAAAAAGLFWKAGRRPRALWRLAALFSGVGWLSSRFEPSEAIHFPEYGASAVLAFRMLGHRLSDPRRLYAAAAALTAAAGGFDEVLQGILPNRYYDLRDVGLNALAGAMGLAAARWAGWIGPPSGARHRPEVGPHEPQVRDPREREGEACEPAGM